MTYKKICVMCGKEFIPNSNVQKYCEECRKITRSKYNRKYYLTHLDLVKQWRTEHSEQIKQYAKQWRTEHGEQRKQHYKQWITEHSEQSKQYDKKYHLKHPEKVKKWNKQWKENNREKYLEIRKKAQNKRKRNLGFEPLNKPQEGFVAHHLNFKKVIYIPKELHQSISHNVFTGKNMHIINALAMDYWEIPENDDFDKEVKE